MHFVRLDLQNWRGVSSRQIAFADSVTLIEGPNEIGKSTIVEAIRMLFRELDSSNKQSVKAIQPVGEDVGSRVEAEVMVGEYHFVYAKTYNKAKQTTLEILRPDKRQLTGREAHEEVDRILAETVDLALWDALLVDQGEKVELAHLSDKAGLAKALDEAAGSSSAPGDDDSVLFEAVQAEYEQYFTLKTAKSRFAHAERDLEVAEAELTDARAELAGVDSALQAHDRAATEVRRLTALLPDLAAKVTAYQDSRNTVRRLDEQLVAVTAKMAVVRERLEATQNAGKERRSLIAAIEAGRKKLEYHLREHEPLANQVDDIKKKAAEVRERLAGIKASQLATREALALAQSDDRYARDKDAVAKELLRIEQLEQCANELKAQVQVVAVNTVTDTDLDALRDAESKFRFVQGQRDTAATSLSLTALQDLTVLVDDDELTLAKRQTLSRSVADELGLHIPGVASIRVVPPQSAAQLQESLDQAEQIFTALAERLDVADMADAVASNQRRRNAQEQVERLKAKQRESLQGEHEDEVRRRVTALQAACDAYLEQRAAEPALPADATASARRVAVAQADADKLDREMDAARERLDELQRELEQIDGKQRAVAETQVRRQATLAEWERRLAEERSSDEDERIEKRVIELEREIHQLQTDGAAIERELAGQGLAAIETMLGNAEDVQQRAMQDLRAQEQEHAVLADRLRQARGDGRFEKLEQAQRQRDDLQGRLRSITRRAQAASLLFRTLERHRNEARHAYVRPLKEAMESLGRIVFGHEFAIAIAEDWSLESRTLNGKTLRFEDLSIGAREQLGILSRLAAAQIVSKHGGVPLIIDDALGFSDPDRQEKMGVAIATAGKTCQIIILTCAPDRFTHVGNAKVIRFARQELSPSNDKDS